MVAARHEVPGKVRLSLVWPRSPLRPAHAKPADNAVSHEQGFRSDVLLALSRLPTRIFARKATLGTSAARRVVKNNRHRHRRLVELHATFARMVDAPVEALHNLIAQLSYFLAVGHGSCTARI